MQVSTKLWSRIATLVPNALVFLVLGSIAWWGHKHHWKIPKASEVGLSEHQQEQKSAPGKLPEDSSLGRQEPLPPPVNEVALSEAIDEADSTTIHFRTADMATHAGIHAVAAVQRRMDEFVTANGVVTYDQTRLAQLSARVPGAVWRVDKQVGQPVKKGDVLAILDAAEVGQAKAELLQAIVMAELKESTYQRLKSVGSVISGRQMAEAEAAAREARFRQFNAQQALINLGLPVRLSSIKGLSDEEAARKLQFLGLPQDLVAELDPTTTTANLIPIVVPFDGTVIGREIVTGEVVQPSQPQFVIADVRKMWIMLDVRKEDAFRVAVGQDILFETDGVPGDIHCKLTWISTEVDQKTRTVQVRAEVDNPLIEPAAGGDGQRRLRANSFGTGRIRVRLQPEAVVVPVNAVQWDGDVNVVFVPREGGKAFVARQVRIGGTTDDFVEILDGLNAGEQVVTSGSHLLKSELERRRALTSN